MHIRRGPNQKIQQRKQVGIKKSKRTQTIEDSDMIDNISTMMVDLSEKLLEMASGSKQEVTDPKPEVGSKKNQNRTSIKAAINNFEFSSSIKECGSENEKITVLIEVLGKDHELVKEFLQCNQGVIKGDNSIKDLTSIISKMDILMVTIEGINLTLDTLFAKEAITDDVATLINHAEDRFDQILNTTTEVEMTQFNKTMIKVKSFVDISTHSSETINVVQDRLDNSEVDSNLRSSTHQKLEIFSILEGEIAALNESSNLENIKESSEKINSLNSVVEDVKVFLETGAEIDKTEINKFPKLAQTLAKYEDQVKFIKDKTGCSEIDSDQTIPRMLQLFEHNILDKSEKTATFLNTASDKFFSLIHEKNHDVAFDLISDNKQSAKWRVGYDVFLKIVLDSSENPSTTLLDHASTLLTLNSDSDDTSPIGITAALLKDDVQLNKENVAEILDHISDKPAEILTSVLQALDSGQFSPEERSAVAGVLTGTLTYKDIAAKNKLIDKLQTKLAGPKIQKKVRNAISNILAKQGNLQATISNSFARQLFNYVSSASTNLVKKENIFGQDQLTKSDQVLLALVSNQDQGVATPSQIARAETIALFGDVDEHLANLDTTNPLTEGFETFKQDVKGMHDVFENKKLVARSHPKIRGNHRSYQEILKIKNEIMSDKTPAQILKFSKKNLKKYLKKNKALNENRQEKFQAAIDNTKDPLKQKLQAIFDQTLAEIKSVDNQLFKKVKSDRIINLRDMQLPEKAELELLFYGEPPNSSLTDVEIESLRDLPSDKDLAEIKEIRLETVDSKQTSISLYNSRHTSKFKRFKNTIFRRKRTNEFALATNKLSNAAKLMGISEKDFISKYETFLQKPNSKKILKNIESTVKSRKRLLNIAQRDVSSGTHKTRDKFIHKFKSTDPLNLSKDQIKGIKKARLILVAMLNKELEKDPNQDMSLLCNKVSKKIALATSDISVLDSPQLNGKQNLNFESSGTLKAVYKYLSSESTPVQVKTYFNAALADLAQIKNPTKIDTTQDLSAPDTTKSIKSATKQVDSKTKYVIQKLQDWTEIDMTKSEKKEYYDALLEGQKRFDETDLVAINKDAYSGLFEKIKENNEIIKIEFKNVYGLTTKLFKPVLSVVAPGAEGSEVTFGYEKNRGIGIFFDKKQGNYKVSMSKEIRKKLAITLKGKMANVSLELAKGNEKDITFSFNEDQMMELIPHLLQAELTAADLEEGMHKADFGKASSLSAELSLNVLGAKLPKKIQGPLLEMIGIGQELDLQVQNIDQVLNSDSGLTAEEKQEFNTQYNALKGKKAILQKNTKDAKLKEKTELLEHSLSSAQTDESAALVSSYEQDANLETENKKYKNLMAEYSNLLEKYPSIANKLPKEDAVAKEIKKTLDQRQSSRDLTTGLSLKGARQTGKVVTSGGLSQIEYTQYSGSISLDVLGSKAPAEYKRKTSVERQRGAKGKSDFVVDKFVEETYLYNKYSPFNKQVRNLLKSYNDLPMFTLPITVKHGLSEKNKAIMLTLDEDKKNAFIKEHLEIVEISTILPLSKTQVDEQDLSMGDKVKKQLKSALGYNHDKKLIATQEKRFVLFPLEEIALNSTLHASTKA
jgi:hypothetical protein